MKENTITMSCSNPNLQSGFTKNRSGYRAATRALKTLKEKHGRTSSFVPQKERVRQRNALDPRVLEFPGIQAGGVPVDGIITLIGMNC